MRRLGVLVLLAGCHCEEETFVWLSRSVSSEELLLVGLEESDAYTEEDCVRLCLALVEGEPRDAPICTLSPWSPGPADTATDEGAAWIDCAFVGFTPCD